MNVGDAFRLSATRGPSRLVNFPCGLASVLRVRACIYLYEWTWWQTARLDTTRYYRLEAGRVSSLCSLQHRNVRVRLERSNKNSTKRRVLFFCSLVCIVASPPWGRFLHMSTRYLVWKYLSNRLCRSSNLLYRHRVVEVIVLLWKLFTQRLLY